MVILLTAPTRSSARPPRRRGRPHPRQAPQRPHRDDHRGAPAALQPLRRHRPRLRQSRPTSPAVAHGLSRLRHRRTPRPPGGDRGVRSCDRSDARAHGRRPPLTAAEDRGLLRDLRASSRGDRSPTSSPRSEQDRRRRSMTGTRVWSTPSRGCGNRWREPRTPVPRVSGSNGWPRARVLRLLGSRTRYTSTGRLISSDAAVARKTSWRSARFRPPAAARTAQRSRPGPRVVTGAGRSAARGAGRAPRPRPGPGRPPKSAGQGWSSSVTARRHQPTGRGCARRPCSSLRESGRVSPPR